MNYPAARESNPVGVGQLTGAEIDLSFDPRAAGIGQAIINACQRIRLSDGRTLDSDLAAGQSHLETGGGTSAIFLDKHNIGGVGALNNDPYNTAHAYPDMQAGADEFVAHLVAYNDAHPSDQVKALDGRYQAALADVPGFPGIVQAEGGYLYGYEQRYAHTYPQSKYDATPLDERYGAKAAGRANVIWERARGVSPVPTQRPPHIALSAGHRNTSGGNAHEQQQTAVLTPAIAAACRALGMDVRVVQGHDGADMFAGDLHAVAQTVAGWDAGGWAVDIYLETHTEGAGGARGMFAIFPDWAGDVDTDVRDTLGPDIVARVTAATGLGKRGSGLMSEQQTGVGAGGDRLGIFAYTAAIKDHATRLIVEYGAHDNAADLAIVDAPGFAGKAGAATAAAFAAFLGWQQTAPQPDQPAQPDALIQPNNPYGAVPIVLGFRGYVEALAAARYPQDATAAILSIVGYAVAPEFATKDGSAQEFERGVLLFDKRASPPWDIVFMRREDAIPEAA